MGGPAEGELQPAPTVVTTPAELTSGAWTEKSKGQEQGEDDGQTHQGSRAYSSILTSARKRRRESGAGPDPDAEVAPAEDIKICGDWLTTSSHSQWEP